MVPLVVFALVIFQGYLVSSAEYLVPENIDVDEILKNDRLTRNYLDCVLERGKCTSEGEQLKKAIPEVLDTNCANCNEKHKTGAKKVFHFLIEKKPQWWKEVTEKFDPKGEYKKKYENYLKEEGLTY